MNKVKNRNSSLRACSQIRGISIIELMIILSIVIMLVGIGIVEYQRFDDKAIRQDALVSAKAIVTAMKLYRLDWEGEYPTDLTPQLYNYTNVTSLETRFSYVELTQVDDAEGVYARVKDIDPIYHIIYVAESDDTYIRFSLSNQPTCCWEKGGIDCAVDGNWYPCKEKM